MTDLKRQLAEAEAKNERLLQSLIQLDAWITERLMEVRGKDGTTDDERLMAADDMERDWFGGGWGASTRDEIEAFKSGDALTALLTEAEKKGARDMRERAARFLERCALTTKEYWEKRGALSPVTREVVETLEQGGKDIRSLPLTGEE